MPGRGVCREVLVPPCCVHSLGPQALPLHVLLLPGPPPPRVNQQLAACRASSQGSCPDVAAQAGVSGETRREETVALATVVAGAERGLCCVWS